MKTAIEILEEKLQDLYKPIPEEAEFEEEDLISAVLYNRQKAELKLALKILKQFMENNKIYNVLIK